MNNVNAAHIRLSLLCYLATALVLFQQLPWLVVVVGAAAGWWRLRVVNGLASLPKPRWVKLLLVSLIALTLWLSRSAELFDKLVSLVMLGYSLKYIELHKRRDVEMFALTGLFLLAFSLVFSSQPLAALLVLIVAFMHLLLLLSLDVKLNLSWLKKLAVWMLAIAPLGLALFVVAPRLAPLWKMPTPSSAQTGLSDVVRPGDISQLIRSDKLVFRAEFSRPPPRDQLYWRAMVLDEFDGEEWTRSELAQKKHVVKNEQAPINQYQLLLEPANQAWLATLNPSELRGGGAEQVGDKSWQRSGESFPRQILSFNHLPHLNRESVAPEQLHLLTRVPSNISANVLQLSRQFSEGLDLDAGGYSEQVMTRLEQWFLSQSFSYTLSPLAYPGLAGIESFLLNQQAGFCVHYAQSAVVLARLQGIPARMVTGYLGGEWEQADQRLAVRNYDAHAWMEYWNGERWIRLDPTAWIAPDRVESNLQQSQATAEQWQNISGWSQRLWYTQGFNQLRLWLAQADYWWAKWVLNFDHKRQLSLFSQLLNWLPGTSLLMLTGGMLLSGVLISALLLAKPWLWRLPNKHVLALKWQLFLLARLKLHRSQGESFTDYLSRIESAAPKRYLPLKRAIQQYNQLRYHG
ncbi:DUF3488 and transglutaminase-like domain-containing protein [Agarivorans sp. 1_MG-2023]|uniref:transglutaminase family protein n=1 Tax=Agarivorans sp. 1_MG-2023 TaxID=3062634 RepID=UPI0026E448EE|nr:DUF3488 and transglutaminase-like domain-containing protein [Agarivorans sp. 1_MG-2023]MDO6762478.1 DUF3488 and transglutaminase-like domain-containing protein [Agarivorans sp. 1_MG-2023]